MKRLVLCLALLIAPLPALAAEPPTVAANAAYLADNAKKPGTVVRPDGLQYRVLRSGLGRRVGAGDIAHIFYSIHLINGTLVDSTTPTLPTTLAVDTASMRGLSEALQLMHPGDRWQLVMPPALAYGVTGAANGAIPPNQALVFDLTVVSSAPPQPGEAAAENPFSVWSNGREAGAAFTIHP